MSINRMAGAAGLAIGLATACLALSSPALGADSAVIKERPANLPGYNVYRPAKAGKRALPVIAWANGGCVRSDFTWSTLFERWASDGFVVITISQAEPLTAAPAPGTGSKAEDQARAIDWAIKETGTAGSPYKGMFDTRRIAAAGNSCGGITSLTLASRDPRVKSLFILSGSSVGPNQKVEAAQPIMSKVKAPVLFITGGPEDISRGPIAMDYDLLPAGVPAMVVSRVSADHRTVSTDKGMQRDEAEMGINWFKATLNGDRQAKRTLNSIICPGCDPKIWSAKSKNFASAK